MDKKAKNVLNDGEIIELFWQRSEAAIEMTDEKYGRFLFRIAYNILWDKSDAEECQNDTYLGIWNSIPPHRPEVFSSYISRIMRNIAIKKLNERSCKKRVPSELTVSADDLEAYLTSGGLPDAELAAEELGGLINNYLDSLNARQRYIFIGRYYMGEKLETLSRELHINASTVHRELEKLKQGLKKHLERNGYYV